MPPSPRRRRLRRSAGDVSLAIGVCLAAELDVLLAGASPRAALLAALWALPLAVRRRAPLAAPLALLLAGALYQIGHEPQRPGLPPVAMLVAALIASFSVAAYAAWPAAVTGGLAAIIGVALYADADAPAAGVADIAPIIAAL